MQVMDSLLVATVVHELQRLIVGTRIDRIHLPTPWEMVWTLRSSAGPRRLLFSARGVHARLHLTEQRFENPAQAPAFCMLLRKHLEGGRVLRVEQPGLERVVQIVCAGRDELGDPTERALVAEITGKHANLLLLDRPWGTILGLLRPVGERESRERQLLPGLLYDPPPTDVHRVDPRVFDPGSLADLPPGGRPVREELLSRVHSLSRAGLDELLEASHIESVRLAGDLSEEELDRLRQTWACFRSEIDTGDFRILREGDRLRVLRLGRPGQGLAPCETLDALFGERWNQEAIERVRHGLRREVRERLEKLASRASALEGALARVEVAETWRLWGDLLLTFAHDVPRGVTTHDLPDIQHPDQPPVSIPLDPTLDATQNAQRHYRRYQKARAGETVSRRLLETTAIEQAYWMGVAANIDWASDVETLREIGLEVKPLPTHPNRQKSRVPEPRPLKLTSRDGLVMWVGRNNRQNDWLTFKVARPEDWWFHARDIPGAHVVVRPETPGDLPTQTREDAAMLAAGFSQARMSSGVPVVYTRRKHVRKPSGAHPGFVLFERERTCYVTPDPDPLAAFGASASSG
jgi:predicted ribosome quality control (RQC) complex YloA/Tae2 family protein